MQRHEGPRRDRDAEERQRQRALTGRLSLVIGLLVGLIVVVAVLRWG